MLWGREMRAGGGRSTASGGRWSSEHGGGVAPVGFGRGKRAGELREVEARLTEGSARAGKLRRGGSTAAWSSPGFCGWRRRVLGSGSEEEAKEQAEWGAGVFVVP